MKHVYLIVFNLDPKFHDVLIRNVEVVWAFMSNIKCLLKTGSITGVSNNG